MPRTQSSSGTITLFLCGDVMLGRGIDQVLPHPSDPRLYEPEVRSALTYVELAEALNGPIPRPVDVSYVWGDALARLDELQPDLRIINLETSITSDGRPWPKGINYRMNPANIGCLTALKVDCCVLANNHVLDWGLAGLAETLESLARAGVATAGAGHTRHAAEAPAILTTGRGTRVLVYGFGTGSSGVPAEWAAAEDRSGVNFLDELSDRDITRAASDVRDVRRDGDVMVASIHWGPNWGYQISDRQRHFAQGLIDEAGFDIIHGHSSHHPKGIEIYRNKPMLYGCGDFIDDYEGIGGYESFRSDLVLGYLARLSLLTRELVDLRLLPFRIRRFRLNRAATKEVSWLRSTLDRESAKFGTRVTAPGGETLSVLWHSS